MNMRNRRAILILPTLALLVSACGAAATPTAAPTAAPTTAPKPTDTAMPKPTDAPKPTDTAMPKATDAPKPTDTPAPTATTAAATMSMDDLVAAAKKEGSLNTIALPHDWANYGELLDTFKTKYGLKLNEINPDGSSAQELEAIKANKDNKGPQAPDVIDVGFGFGPDAATQDLVQPYKVATWDTIPDVLKDKDGKWYGDYYGVLSFEVNKDVVKNVPQDWADLLKPEYKGQIALAGDPRQSNQAWSAVWAAALANGGSLDNPQPGLDFFAKLNKSGNLVPVIAKAATIGKGETPIVLRWDYNALGDRDTMSATTNIAVVVPPSGVIAGVYVQAISKYAPNPNAAKLWMEYLYSDAGQIGWLKGYAHPIRYNDLAKRGVIPADLAAKLPPADVYAKAAFPTLDQITKAKDVITKNWDAVVGLDVK